MIVRIVSEIPMTSRMFRRPSRSPFLLKSRLFQDKGRGPTSSIVVDRDVSSAYSSATGTDQPGAAALGGHARRLPNATGGLNAALGST